MRILVLGGYGLIGSHVVSHLIDEGHEVVALGRNVVEAARRMPQARWIAADISKLTTGTAWTCVLADACAEVIVNCAGALQDGSLDDVARVQSAAMRALYAAAPAVGVTRFVQISATRADPQAETVFMRSKGEADAALQASELDWVILRPGLVIAPQAYGGTALLRALAAFPLVQPLAYASSPVQTVAVIDVARAVAAAVSGEVASRQVYDLVEDHPHSLGDVVRQMRSWLGLAAAPVLHVPGSIVHAVARVADGLGWLGWRSPLRTTAITELAAGIAGDPGPWRSQTGRSLSPLETTLQRLPSTVQERWFARAYLLKPLAIAVLSAFWIVTGAVALVETEAAASVLTSRGVDVGLAKSFVLTGAAVDLVLGLALLWRTATVRAAIAMIAVTIGYLAAGSLLAPDLWADPLGPFVKALPAIMLALAVLATVEDR